MNIAVFLDEAMAINGPPLPIPADENALVEFARATGWRRNKIFVSGVPAKG